MQPTPTDTALPPSPQSAQSASEYVQTEEFRKFIEVEVLKVIKTLAEGETPSDKIQEIARFTLEKVKPHMDLESLYHSAITLDDTFAELAPVTFQASIRYEEKYGKKALTIVSQLVKNGKYDEAETVVKKVLEYKII